MNEALWRDACAVSHSHPDLLRRMIEQGTPGNVLEGGTAGGGSALALLELVPVDWHFLVTVDPWGTRPYATSSARYGENFQRGALCTIGNWAYDLGKNWHHFKMESLEFFEHVAPLGCWYGGEHRDYRFDTVFLDGEHMVETVIQELWFLRGKSQIFPLEPCLNPNAVIFVDNANHEQGKGIGMEQALQMWADENRFTLKLIPLPDNDLLAELRAAE